ncbi:uncharacterized protein G2W53_041585 [Senna tora]|uniref:Uncharacterized protein n=1 Tax=Senna tora TaxID=362788 RepID=A0A834W318_9FABA|nr:uncharacterized protein G2W53_041585 [Senna tora]
MDDVLRPPPKPPEFVPGFQINKSVMRLKTHCFPASNSTGALADRSGAFSDDVTTLRPSLSTSFHASSCAMTSSPPNLLSPPPALPMSCFAFLALQVIPTAALPSHPCSHMATRAAMAFLPMTTPSRVFLASFSTAVAPSLHPPSSKVPTPLSCSAVMLSLTVAGSILLGFPLRPHKPTTILFLFFSKPSSAATQSFSNTAMKSLLQLKKTTFKDKMLKAISINPTPDQVSSWFNTSIILPCLPPSLTHTPASRTSAVKDGVAKVISGELLLSSSASSLPAYSLPSNEALIVGFLDMAQHLSDPDPIQHCCYRLFDVSICQISLIWLYMIDPRFYIQPPPENIHQKTHMPLLPILPPKLGIQNFLNSFNASLITIYAIMAFLSYPINENSFLSLITPTHPNQLSINDPSKHPFASLTTPHNKSFCKFYCISSFFPSNHHSTLLNALSISHPLTTSLPPQWALPKAYNKRNLNYPSDATSCNDRTTVAKDILLFASNPPDPH